MSTTLSNAVGHSTVRRTNHWFAIAIWIAVLVASLAAVTASVAHNVIGA
jgi:hypothetical protein